MTRHGPQQRDASDDRVKLPLEPEEALRALLAVDPDAPPADEGNGDEHGQDEQRTT